MLGGMVIVYLCGIRGCDGDGDGDGDGADADREREREREEEGGAGAYLPLAECRPDEAYGKFFSFPDVRVVMF